ncbi:MAG: cell envelope integrity protein TolA [Nevskiales bacterium]
MWELLRTNKRPLLYAVGLHVLLFVLLFVSFDWLSPKPAGSPQIMQAVVVSDPVETSKERKREQEQREEEQRREEEALTRAADEARKKIEEEVRKKTQEEAKQKAIQEAKRKKEEDEKRQIALAEEKRKKQEEDCKRERAKLKRGEITLAQISKACLTPEDVEKIQQDDQLKREAEAEAKRQADAEARQKAEEEARKKAEEDAKKKAEADKKRAEAAEAARKKAELDAQDKRRREEEAFERAGLDRMRADEERQRMQAELGPAINAYIIKLNRHVTPNWIRPPSGPGLFKCLLYVRQRQDGTIVDVRIKSSCGNPALDDSVLRAMRKSSPLPLPDDLRVYDEELEFLFEPRN